MFFFSNRWKFHNKSTSSSYNLLLTRIKEEATTYNHFVSRCHVMFPLLCFLCCFAVLQASCTTTRRRMTVLSTWPGSAICSPPSLCSWSRWLGAGSRGGNWLRSREQKTAVRPMAASTPTACRTALCRGMNPGKASDLELHAHYLPWACIPSGLNVTPTLNHRVTLIFCRSATQAEEKTAVTIRLHTVVGMLFGVQMILFPKAEKYFTLWSCLIRNN